MAAASKPAQPTATMVRGHSPTVGYGFMLCLAGELAAAREQLKTAELIARERGDEVGLAVVCGVLTTLETTAGDWRQAEAYARETVELAEHTGVNWHESLYARALLDVHLGRVEPALEAAHELVAEAERGGSLVYLVRSLSVLGFLELSRGNTESAGDVLCARPRRPLSSGSASPACCAACRTVSRRSLPGESSNTARS